MLGTSAVDPVWTADATADSPAECPWRSRLALVTLCLVATELPDPHASPASSAVRATQPTTLNSFGLRAAHLRGCCAQVSMAIRLNFNQPLFGTSALKGSSLGFFNDATMGPAWASCADVGERYAGTLSGAMNMTGAFAGAAGMALAGVLFHQRKDDLVFILFGCSYALASLCWLLVDVSKPLVRKDAFTER